MILVEFDRALAGKVLLLEFMHVKVNQSHAQQLYLGFLLKIKT